MPISWYDENGLSVDKELTNLFDELTLKLKKYNYTEKDVMWCNIAGISVPWEEFVRLAQNTNYDPGYGIVEIPPITIMMSDGSWFERSSYDGMEKWARNSKPTQGEKYSNFIFLEDLRNKKSQDIIEALLGNK